MAYVESTITYNLGSTLFSMWNPPPFLKSTQMYFFPEPIFVHKNAFKLKMYSQDKIW